MQQADAGGHGEGFVLVVGDEDEGGAGLALDAEEFLPGLLAEVAVERGHGFVEQQERRAWGEGAGKGNALALAAGKDVGAATGEVLHADEAEQGSHALGDLGARPALAAEAEGDVVGDGHMGKEGVGLEGGVDRALVRREMGDVLAAQRDAAEAGRDEAAEGAQQRGLAAAGAAEQDEHLAAADREVQAVEGCQLAEVDDEVLDFQAGRRGLSAIRAAWLARAACPHAASRLHRASSSGR